MEEQKVFLRKEDVLVPTKTEKARQDEPLCHVTPSTWKTIAGIFIVLGIAISWVGSTQFAQSTYTSDFNAPYFTTWFATCWMTLVFPMVYCFNCVINRRRRDIGDFFRESEKVFGSDGMCIRTVFTMSASFCILWMIVNYMYLRALGEINAADVTAIFSSASAFVYVFSFLLLDEKLSVVRVTAVIFSISGIVLFGYAEGFKGGTGVGVVLSLGSAIGAALYKVMFKRQVGDASASHVSLFLSCLGIFNMLILWFIFEIFYFTKYEKIDWFNAPWGTLCGTASLGLVFNFLINFGIAFTFPLFISLGTVIGIPLNALVDLVYRQKEFGEFKIIAALLVIVGFLCMLIPLEYEQRFLWDRLCRRDHQENDNEGIQEASA